MNVAIILSGGSGKRFGAKLPKQYLDLCDRPVIHYVIEAALAAKTIDEIILVMNKDYLEYVNSFKSEKIHIVPNGTERLNSVKNGLDYIEKHFENCENMIILQAVSPFVSASLIDTYIQSLDEYDVVTTAEKCPGELFDVTKYHKIDRNQYYFCQSPEAFKFRDLYRFLDVNSKFSELIYHYPTEPKINFYLDFHHNVKLTFQSDLDYATFLMKRRNNEKI